MQTPSPGTSEGARLDQTQSGGPVATGPAAAAIVSAGAGSCALGIFAVIADGSKSVARWLAFYHPSGPLSGVSTAAIFVWLGIWFVLAKRWRSHNISLAKTNAVAFILLACGLLLTFPPFVDLLLGK